MFIGYRRGLIGTVFKLISFVLAIFLASYLYPTVAEWMRTTPVFTGLKDYIMRTMGLEDIVQAHAGETIASLPLPDLLRQALTNHNTPNIFELLNVHTIEEYIAGFFAGMAINIIAMLAVFIIVRLIFEIIAGLLDLVARLPVVRTFNRGGGLLFGFIQGIIIVWLGLAFINLFFLNPTTPALATLLDESLLAGWIYEHNPIMVMLSYIR
ncbi:MAG: CvpA family protein [Defluviitaleaceae bacterium]|nr:CvpA family protein [Defluviitaleaceae bacterium]